MVVSVNSSKLELFNFFPKYFKRIGIPFFISGSPPVILIFFIPKFIKTLQILFISSDDRIYDLGKNRIFSFIQYTHLKSHLSVTDTRK